MKKLLLFLMIATLGCGNVYSQAKKTPAKRTQTAVSAKAKAEAEAKAKAEAEAKAKAEAEAAENARRIAENNSKCSFSFTTGDFVSRQYPNDFVIYEVQDMSASELKTSVYTILSSMFKSPKDAITNLNDNMIQLDGYTEGIFEDKLPIDGSTVLSHFFFSITIQFKDGKVRYNIPTLNKIHMKVVGSNTESISNISGVNMKDYLDGDSDKYAKLKKIENYFNNLIASINAKLKQSNDW